MSSSLRRPLLSFVCLCFLSAAAVLGAEEHGAHSTGVQKLPTISYEKYRLKNGLEVILSEDHTVPLVSVNIWYHVGPANERPGRTGFAHLFEHMMFEGSEHIEAKAHFKYLEGAGATDINGTTNFDHTKYFETVPSNRLELALWLESDRMGYLLPTLDGQKLANQRDVVRNERRQTTENVPYGVVGEAVYHELFPEGHPYYGVVIGSHADIEAVGLGDVREFFREYYTPNNASLVIAGDFDSKNAKAMVEKYFASIPAGPVVPKILVNTPPITSERRKVMTDQVELSRVYMAWLAPPIYQPGDAESDLLAYILGGGKTSRLYRSLVYEKQIAQDVSVENESLSLGSVFQIEITGKPGVSPEDLEKAINPELEKLRSEGPTEEELARAVNVLQAAMVRGLEGSGRVANQLNNYNHYLGNPGYLGQDFARYGKIRVTDLKRAARNELRADRRVVVYAIPGPKVLHDVPKTSAEEDTKDEKLISAERSTPGEAWREKPPEPSAALRFAPPSPINFTLPNGLTVLLVERHNLPIVSAHLVVVSGAEVNPVDKPGLASFVTDLLEQGTERRSALEVASALEQIGTSLSTSSGYDSSSVAIRTLSRNTDASFDLLSDVALHPAFEEKEIERLRSQRLAAIVEENENASRLRTKTLNHVLYGNSTYGYSSIGTDTSNKSIAREDLMGFWKRGFVPSNAALVVAGDLTEAQLRTMAEKYFSSWSGCVFAAAPPESPKSPERTIYIVDKPHAPQTSLAIGTIGVARSTPDYVPLQVMNSVFGGQFSSRLNMNLREEHGYTYGAHSSFGFRRGAGPFSAWGGIRTNVTAPAVTELFLEVRRIRETAPTVDELRRAKDSWSLSLAGDFETTSDIATTEGNLFLYQLPFNYYATLAEKIEAVTAARVQEVANRYLNPDKMVVVAVGDRAQIEPELRKLDLGNVEIVP